MNKGRKKMKKDSPYKTGWTGATETWNKRGTKKWRTVRELVAVKAKPQTEPVATKVQAKAEPKKAGTGRKGKDARQGQLSLL